MTYFGILWTDTRTNESALCEVEGGVCYESFAYAADAISRSNELNRAAEAEGWNSLYTVVPLPADVQPCPEAVAAMKTKG